MTWSQDLRRRFYATVLGVPPTEKFRLPGTPIPVHIMTFKSSRVILKYVASTPQAIGYVPVEHLDSSVKVLRVDGLLPDDAELPRQVGTPRREPDMWRDLSIRLKLLVAFPR